MQGGDNAAKIEAGLPNIVGELKNISNSVNSDFFGDVSLTEISTSGALRADSNEKRRYSISNTSTYYTDFINLISFDASEYNSVYGNSTTVQPPAIKLISQIKF